MAQMLLAPPMAAPYATSVATFSFGAHSQYSASLYCGRDSKISVLGVPGYAEQTLTPASYAPLAMASLPDIRCLVMEISLLFIQFADLIRLYYTILL